MIGRFKNKRQPKIMLVPEIAHSSDKLSNNYHSQIGQDEWVHSVLGNKQNGFFIELGACDGLFLSNTLFFERELKWSGICIEPNIDFFNSLQHNRTCFVRNDLISSVQGNKVQFSNCSEMSGIIDITSGPFTVSNKSKVVIKITNTLENVLKQFNAPNIIEYLSLDVEGHEFSILSTFPFDKYKFKCITVEHNAPHVGPTQQLLIRDILERNGYIYIKGNDDILEWNHGPIDDFYIHSEYKEA